MSDLLAYLRSFRHLTTASEGDGELLRRFRLQRDEQAFAILVQRHGSLVLGIIRRVLGQSEIVDDVFQATFLVLARRGKAMEKWPSVAGWLVQVARRTALQAQAKVARRHKHEQRAATMSHNTCTIDPANAVTQQELAARLDAELVQLPSKYRLPLVLCQLEGQTKEETARQLGWPVGSLSGRLARGKKLLHDRLVRSGFAPSLAAGALALSKAEAELPALLVQATTLLASSAVHQTGTLSKCAAVTLAQGVMTTMFVSKLKCAAMVLMVLGLSAGTAAWAWQGSVLTSEAMPSVQQGVQSKPKSLLEQIQGVWQTERIVRDGKEESLEVATYLIIKGNRFGLSSSPFLTERVTQGSGRLILHETTQPCTVDFVDDNDNSKSHYFSIVKRENDKLITLTGTTKETSGTTDFTPKIGTLFITYVRTSDYDRLEGIWRYEERNPVTNDLDRATELIFKKNMYVRRSYIKGSLLEDKPTLYQLNEKAFPNQLDLEIRSTKEAMERFSLLPKGFEKNSTQLLEEYRILERRLAIYELKDNEFRYAITGAIPFKLDGEQLVPNLVSPLNKRAASLETAGSPILTFKRVERSLKDEGNRTPITEKPAEEQETASKALQPTSSVPRKLLEERLKIAEESMALWKAAREAGNPSASSTELSRISEQLLSAKMALAQNQTEKLRAMEEHLQILKQLENLAESMYKSGRIIKLEFLNERFKRVEFEIKLEELRGNPSNTAIPK